MKRIKHFAACVVLSLSLLPTPAPAADDPVKTILQFLSDAKIINPKIVEASALIRCFAEYSPEQCVDLQQAGDDLASDATSAGEKKAAEFIPDDPMVRTAVDIVRAVLRKEWLGVLELTGVKLLGQVACTAGLAVTGPLEPFICGKFATNILAKAEPVVHEVLVIVRDFPEVNVWKLITVVGFELGCEIVKDEGVPLADEACGLLGEVIAAIKDLADAAIGALGAGAEAVTNVVTAALGGGGSDQMSAEKFYNLEYRPLIYKRALQRITQNRQDLGFDDSDHLNCMNRFSPGLECGVHFPQKLHNESEALVKLVLTMPETYVAAYLADDVRIRAVERFGQGNASLQYVNKLPIGDWAELVNGPWGVSLMASYTGMNIGDQEYLKDMWRECRSWVNEKLIGSRGYGVPVYEDIAPQSLSNWICFKGAAQQFFQAQINEENRIAKVKKGLNSLGCPSIPGTPFSFNCQSHVSFSICINQSYKDYGENRYCKADRDMTARSLGMSLVNVLGETRCRYVPLSKGDFGDFDPRVQCSRPWKQQTCDVLLDTFRAKFEVPSSRIQMRCAYNPDKEFLAQEARAKLILAVLNGGPAVALSPDIGRRSLPPAFDSTLCKTLWDPLAINCPHQTKMPDLSGDLATPPIESCPPDPNKNGANHVCYQTVFTADDSNRELFENQPLSPISAVPQGLPPSPAAPVRTATVSRQPVPSPVATAGSATVLPGAAVQPAPVTTTMSGSPPGLPEPNLRTAPAATATVRRQPEASPVEPATRSAVPVAANQSVAFPSDSESGAAPARTAAPAIRALNTQNSESEAPPDATVGSVALSRQADTEANAAPARTAAPAVPATNAQNARRDDVQAPPNPCRMEVSYYIPEAPVLATNGSALQVNDQLQIQCAFKKVTRNIEWSQCDDSARSAIQVLKGAQEAGGRYSGIVSIDDSTVGVSSSPESGVDFQSIKLWKFEKPGTHKISCQTDNAFRFAAEGEETYLNAAVSVDVGSRSDGLTYRGFESVNATTLRVRPVPSEASPRLRGLNLESVEPASGQPRGNDMVNPALNPQPEVPSSKRAGGNDMVNPALNPQPEVPSSKQAGGNDMVNPALNPQPEVPSSKRAGGNDMVNPSLNPQPEVPSSKRAGGNDMVNPSLNPQPEVPSSKRAGGNDMVNPSLNPQPEVPSPRGNDTAITVEPETQPLPELVVPKPVENGDGS